MYDAKRRVVTELEIIAVTCPNCHAPKGAFCRNSNRHVLALHDDINESIFHQSRVHLARSKQGFNAKLGHLNNSQKELIVYYAFVILCEEVAKNTKDENGGVATAEQIQVQFVRQGIEELRIDGFLK